MFGTFGMFPAARRIATLRSAGMAAASMPRSTASLRISLSSSNRSSTSAWACWPSSIDRYAATVADRREGLPLDEPADQRQGLLVLPRGEDHQGRILARIARTLAVEHLHHQGADLFDVQLGQPLHPLAEVLVVLLDPPIPSSRVAWSLVKPWPAGSILAIA